MSAIGTVFIVWLVVTAIPLCLVMCIGLIKVRASTAGPQMAEEKGPFPAVDLFIPLKGTFNDQENVLRSLLEQDYPSYHAVFIVESDQDPAVAVVDRLCSKYAHARRLVSGVSRICAQKNHSLNEGTKRLRPETGILVFCDSTNAAGPHWLAELTRPLRLGQAEVASTFRDIDPDPQSIAGVSQAIYAAFVLMLALNKPTPWGGATAIQRRTFEKLRVADEWSRTVVDDLVLGNLLDEARIKVFMNPASLMRSPLKGQSVSGVVNYLDRQILFPKFTNRGLWVIGLVHQVNLTVAVLAAGAVGILAPAGLVPPATGWYAYGFLGAVLGTVLILHRFNPFSISLASWLKAFLPCLILTSFVFLRSARRNYIDWHGRRYWPGPRGVVNDITVPPAKGSTPRRRLPGMTMAWSVPLWFIRANVRRCAFMSEKMNIHRKMSFSVAYVLLAFLLVALLQVWLSPRVETVSYSKFKKFVADGKINSVVVSSKSLRGYEKGQEGDKEPLFPKKIYITPRVDDPSLVGFLEQNNAEIVAENENTFLMTLLSWILPALIFGGIWIWVMKKMGQGAGIMTLGKNKARIVAQTDVGVTFDDVAGQDEAKQELEEILEFLRNPDRFTRIGAKIPKGVLLVGPPGTGKTLLAKAVAGEAGVPFFSISGSDFIEMFVGLGAARVRDLFEEASKKAPCLVFIDELDALGKARGAGISGGHDEREQTLNQLLVEMDGFQANQGVVILAATNRPEILDTALLRPGRFDRHILVDRPDLNERVAILHVHTRKVPLSEKVDLDVIARRTPGFTGADLANLVNEAALLAARQDKTEVGPEELEMAIDRIVAGLEKKNRVLNETEKKTVAFHETGHALVATFRKTAEKVHKISIVPRGIGALGFTLQLPTEDRYLMSRTELLEKIDVLLGGRGAELVTFNEVTTGAQNDLQRATEIARSMVTLYGMTDNLGAVAYQHAPTPALMPQAYIPSKDISEETSRMIDNEVRTIIDSRLEGVLKTLRDHEETLKLVAGRLLEKETIEADEFMELIGRDGNGTHSQACLS